MIKCNNPRCGFSSQWSDRHKICPKCGFIMHPIEKPRREYSKKVELEDIDGDK